MEVVQVWLPRPPQQGARGRRSCLRCSCSCCWQRRLLRLHSLVLTTQQDSRRQGINSCSALLKCDSVWQLAAAARSRPPATRLENTTMPPSPSLAPAASQKVELNTFTCNVDPCLNACADLIMGSVVINPTAYVYRIHFASDEPAQPPGCACPLTCSTAAFPVASAQQSPFLLLDSVYRAQNRRALPARAPSPPAVPPRRATGSRPRSFRISAPSSPGGSPGARSQHEPELHVRRRHEDHVLGGEPPGPRAPQGAAQPVAGRSSLCPLPARRCPRFRHS